jgi:GT2 family glycosyltransferase
LTVKNHRSLVKRLAEFLLFAAQEQAGVYFVSDTPLDLGCGHRLSVGRAWQSACRTAACVPRYRQSLPHVWDIRTDPSSPVADSRSETRPMELRPPRLSRRLAGLAVALRSASGWGAVPYFHPPVEPMAGAEFDLGPGKIISGGIARETRFLNCRILLNQRHCGMVGLPLYTAAPPELTASRVRAEFYRWYSPRWLRHLAQLEFDALPAVDQPVETNRPAAEENVSVDGWPRLEVILATHDRPAALVRIIDSLQALRLPIVLRVVDSNPPHSHTRDLCRARDIPYLLSPPPGKTRALNLGIRASQADILLFTDDDAVVHPEWSFHLRAGFLHPRVMGVTGLVLPLENSTPAQYYFEMHMEEYEMGGLRRGFMEREFCRPYPLYRCAHAGTGVNMAIRRAAFERIGYFAETLSPGTPCRAGEEVDIFFRLMKAGYSIIYNPRALVWHQHRRRMEELEELLFNYGVSTGSCSTRWFIREGAFRSLYYLWRWNIIGLTMQSLRNRTGYPVGLLMREVLGGLSGPLYYLKSLAQQARYTRRRERPFSSGKPDES